MILGKRVDTVWMSIDRSDPLVSGHLHIGSVKLSAFLPSTNRVVRASTIEEFNRTRISNVSNINIASDELAISWRNV